MPRHRGTSGAHGPIRKSLRSHRLLTSIQWGDALWHLPAAASLSHENRRMCRRTEGRVSFAAASKISERILGSMTAQNPSTNEQMTFVEHSQWQAEQQRDSMSTTTLLSRDAQARYTGRVRGKLMNSKWTSRYRIRGAPFRSHPACPRKLRGNPTETASALNLPCCANGVGGFSVPRRCKSGESVGF